MKTSSFTWSNFGLLLAFIWYLTAIPEFVVCIIGPEKAYGFTRSLVFSLVWLIPFFLFPSWTRSIATFLGIAFLICSITSISYYIMYHGAVSQSVFFAIFETNFSEGKEFLGTFLNIKVILVALIYIAGAIFLFYKLKPVPIHGYYHLLWLVVFSPLIFSLPKDIIKEHMSPWESIQYRMHKYNYGTPWLFIDSFMDYQKTIHQLKNFEKEHKKMAAFTQLSEDNALPNKTVVLVIGESTNRNRMSLYGYEINNTSPNLKKWAQDTQHFHPFTQVVSPRPYTIEALQWVLTQANRNNPQNFLSKPNLLDMMQQLGYKTYWISNQQALTSRNTFLTLFARQMDEQVFLNTSRNQNANSYDENVLPPFSKALNDPAAKKFIVIHLIGTHMDYQYRYPKDFAQKNRMKVPCEVVQHGNTKAQNYANYDKSVLYNDYILDQLLSHLKKTVPNSLLVYFSDHGEEVYDSPPHQQLGRTEYVPTRSMYTVPFFVWTSDHWAQTYPLSYTSLVDRNYSTENFINTWADLLHISFDGFDPKQSVIHPEYQTQEWMIGDPLKKESVIPFSSLPKIKPFDQGSLNCVNNKF